LITVERCNKRSSAAEAMMASPAKTWPQSAKALLLVSTLKQLEAGRTAADVARELGVSKHTIYAWRAKYGGLDVSQAPELRQLTDENHRLKRLVADLSLDKEMLKAVIAKNGWSS